jgi:hypothetical protein
MMINLLENQDSVKTLKSQYKSFKEAKEALNLKARSWSALVQKLTAPNYEQIKEQLVHLQEKIDNLCKENQSLKQSMSKNDGFDKIGFWLLDNNFDRSRFSDFDIPEEATRIESVAKVFYKKISQKYHPDKDGTEMQMSNVNRLYEQMMTLVEMNNGLGK